MTMLPGYAEWRNYMPFYRQADVDDAVMLFKDIEQQSGGDALRKARAMAWRSYATLTALHEEWEIKDWGSGENPNERDALAAQAIALAEEAVALQEDFDTLWALAFARMYAEDAEALQVVERAIRLAFKQAEMGPTEEERSYAALSLSSLLAEATDIYIYQGEIEKALASIYEALYRDARDGMHSPDWYHWMHALALFNQALLLEDSDHPGDRDHAQGLYRRVVGIFENDMKRSRFHHRFEFDSLRVLAAARWKLKDGGASQEVELFVTKLRNRKAEWSAQKEIRRLKYLATGDAALLESKWQEIAQALF